MNTKKILLSLFAGVVGATVMGVSAMAQTNEITFAEFLANVEAGNGTYDGNGVNVLLKTTNGCKKNGGECSTCEYVSADAGTPNRIQGTNAQYHLFSGEAVDIDISGVNFVADKSDGVAVCHGTTHGWNGAFEAGATFNVELQFENHGSISLDDCTFDGINASLYLDGKTTDNGYTAEITGCSFENVYNAYGIKQVSAANVLVEGNTFENCAGGVYITNGCKGIVISDNVFSDMGTNATDEKQHTSGLIQIAASVALNDGVQIIVSDNESDGSTPVIRQLSSNVKEIFISNNTFGDVDMYTDDTVKDNEVMVEPVVSMNSKNFANLKSAVEYAEANNISEIELLADSIENETVVITKDITINGNGFTVKGADVTETETNGTAVTPITINGAEVTLINITVKGGNAYNNDPYQPTASHGVAGAAVNVTNGKVTIDNSTLAGGDAGAEYTKSTGSAIVATDSDIIVTNSTLATGRTTRSNVIGVATVYLDDVSTIDLTDVVLDTAKSTYASDNVIASFHANGQDTTEYTGKVKLDGEILIRGTRLANVNIVAGENLTFKGNIDPSYISDTLYIQFDKKDIDAAGEDNDEEADLYDIVVYGNKNYINRLNSADLTFILESDTSVKPVYEILPVNPVKITTDADYENRYMFSFDGVTQPDDTAKSIVIGQVKISGYGAYTFKVNGAVDENIVNASETADSIVEHFYVGGKTDGKGELDLTTDVDDDGSLTPVINAEIVVPTRDLEIVIDFPNAVAKNAAAYQDMTVTVAGGDLDDAVIIKLGNEAVETKIATEYEKKDAKFTVDVSADNKYTVKVVDILTVNTSYTVTVEGAGYRTARYTVTMNCEESKTLNFWNNVKDNAVEVEEDKETSKKNVTFLAGDIVKDAIINIYDLSAVVSYFGEIDLSETNNKEYAKYDLNRDGKIDSKDVAYVLVSWGK